MKKLQLLAASAAVLFANAAATAGEITGEGTFIDVNGKSSCAFSGLNDTPDGDIATSDPGGRVQSYGFFMSQTWLGDFINPLDNDPNEPSFIPGWACNPHKSDPFEP